MRKAEERKIIETYVMVYCDICAKPIGEEASMIAQRNSVPELSILNVNRNEWRMTGNKHFHASCLDQVCTLKEDEIQPRIV